MLAGGWTPPGPQARCGGQWVRGTKRSVFRSHRDLQEERFALSQSGGWGSEGPAEGRLSSAEESAFEARRLAPGPTLPASTRTLLLLKKGDPPGQSSPSREPRAVTPVPLYLVVSVSTLLGGRGGASSLPFLLSFRMLRLYFSRGSQDQTCCSLSPAAFRGGTWGYPWPSVPLGVLRGAADGGPARPASARGLSDTLLAGCRAPR